MKKATAILLVCFILLLCTGCGMIRLLGRIQRARHDAATPPQASAGQLATPEPAAEPAAAPTAAVEMVINEPLTLPLGFGEKFGYYTGEMIDGLPHGEGNFTSENESGITWTYSGPWEQGHMQGYGTTIWDSGWSETGMYQDDYLTQGESYNGDVLAYQGEYADETFHGKGITYDEVGNVIFDGTFQDGFLIETEQARQSRATYLQTIAEPFPVEEYEDCINNADAYKGRMVELFGPVFADWYADSTGAYAEFGLLHQDEMPYMFDVYYRYGTDEQRIAEEGWVVVYGVITDIYTYTDGAGKVYNYIMIEAHYVGHDVSDFVS